mmetsp:Transcript_3119/g.4159  ORF Transcript_3119/g.4159 Transcript_3119/m.4159 type:complete len:334 (-) Transcript_3119:247-1248(-)
MVLVAKRNQSPIFGKRWKIFLTTAITILSISKIFKNTTIFENARVHDVVPVGGENSSQCLLKDAYHEGSFHIFSHRSFFNGNDQTLSCQDALKELRDIGVNHLDVDLVLEVKQIRKSSSTSKRLIVAHPMEYKQTSSYYSPCANTLFSDFFKLVSEAYGNDDFFISMEPKASWHQSDEEIEDSALAQPIEILSEVKQQLENVHLNRSLCAIIVDLKLIEPDSEERETLKAIQEQCQLYTGVRVSDPVPKIGHTDIWDEYDAIMPTIEFHPRHANRKEIDQSYPDELLSKSVFWVVDNRDDLILASEFSPMGIVSNRPKDIVSIIRDDSSWCTK